MKFKVTTNRIFISDTVSVGRGIFDTNDYPEIDPESVMKICEKHPRDIHPCEKGEDDGKPSRVEKGNNQLPREEGENKTVPEKKSAPEKTKGNEGDESGSDDSDPNGQPDETKDDTKQPKATQKGKAPTVDEK